MSFTTNRPQRLLPNGTGCGGLTIHWQPDGTMWVGTPSGTYICTSNDVGFVAGLIEAERTLKPDPVGRPYLFYGAREIVDPGQGEREEKLELERRAASHAAFLASRKPQTKLPVESGEDLLKSLGI